MSTPPEDIDPPHNHVFERLAADSDIGGALAYALYKRAKREWVIGFRKKHGRAPSDDELRGYAQTLTDAVLNAYQVQARQLLVEYAQNVIQDESPRLIKDAAPAIIEAAKPSIERDALRGTFWGAVWPSVVASIIFSLLLAGIVLIAALLGFGLPIQIPPVTPKV